MLRFVRVKIIAVMTMIALEFSREMHCAEKYMMGVMAQYAQNLLQNVPVNFLNPSDEQAKIRLPIKKSAVLFLEKGMLNNGKKNMDLYYCKMASEFIYKEKTS
ncbi:hypothetical protein ACW0KB_03375 [Virgibacillus salarius]|nr:hypothetical protein [uncultured Virgibacillus sp.]